MSCPDIPLKWLQRWVYISTLHVFSILSESSDCLESGPREWILILRTRHLMPSNTKKDFWSIWRMDTEKNIDVRHSINPKAYRAAISSPLQQIQHPFNHPLIHMICPAMMKNTEHLTMWQKWHPDEVIMQHADSPPLGCIWIRHLKHQRTGGKLIQISMISTLTQWRLAVHFGYRRWPNGGTNNWKHTQSTPISSMWHARYSQSYHLVSEWRAVLPLAEMYSAGGSQNPQARPFAKKWFQGSLLEPITRF